jgi:3-oxoacyl-[acyl-carrier-protein] synthase-3
MLSPSEAVAHADAAAATPVRTAGITGLGSALPPGVVSNAAVAPAMGVDSAWIERRTGIRNRRHAAPGDRLTDLAARAGAAALEAAELAPEDLDLVLVATLSADELTPNAGPQVAHLLGATSAGAIDIGAACAGFVSALALASGLVEAGRADTVLVIGAEILSRHSDPTDKRTGALFGDGAGAVVLAAGASGCIGPAILACDGAAAPFIRAQRDTGVIEMDGHETFKLAVSSLVSSTHAAVTAAGLTLADIDLFVYHQANGRILTAVAERLDAPAERVVDVIADLGNTSAASIPLALAQAAADGRLEPGMQVLLGAVGAGFTWGAVVVEWGSA